MSRAGTSGATQGGEPTTLRDPLRSNGNMTVCSSYDGYRLTISSFATAGRTTVCVETFELEIGPVYDSLTPQDSSPRTLQVQIQGSCLLTVGKGWRVLVSALGTQRGSGGIAGCPLSSSTEVHSPLHQLEHYSITRITDLVSGLKLLPSLGVPHTTHRSVNLGWAT